MSNNNSFMGNAVGGAVKGFLLKKFGVFILLGVLLISIVLFLPMMIVVAILPSPTTDDVKISDYKNISSDFSLNWVEPLVIDTVLNDNDFTNINYDTILNTCLDFMAISLETYVKVKVYEKNDKGKEVPVYEWQYNGTSRYIKHKNIKYILESLGYDVSNSKNIKKAIDDLQDKQIGNVKYTAYVEYFDVKDILKGLNAEKYEWASTLLSQYIVQYKYDEYVELPDHIAVKTSSFFAFPTPNLSTITSPYGDRINPVTNKKEFHLGIDISGYNASGSPIIASADGTVIQTSSSGSYGLFVKMEHKDDKGNKWYTRYAHMKQISVSVDDKLKQGDVVGAVGSTGQSTGAHLHFEIYYKSQVVNPSDYLP